jgi:hypothetical protein
VSTYAFASKEELLALTPEQRAERLPCVETPSSATLLRPYRGVLNAMNNFGVFGEGPGSVYVAPYLAEIFWGLDSCYLMQVTKILGKNPRAEKVDVYPHASIVHYLERLPEGVLSHADVRKVALYVQTGLDWDALLGKDCYDLPASTEYRSVKSIHKTLIMRYIQKRDWFTGAVRRAAGAHLDMSGNPSPYRFCEAIYPLCADIWTQVKRDLVTVGFYDERGANWAGKPLFTPVTNEQITRFTFEDAQPRRYILEVLWRERVGMGEIEGVQPTIVLHQRSEQAEYCVVRLVEDARTTVVISQKPRDDWKRHLFVSIKNVHIYAFPNVVARSALA